MDKARVLIAGGSGLIGSRLSVLLQQAGYEVRHLSRTVTGKEPFPTFRWDAMKGALDTQALEGVSHIINLAGAGIADGRWTESRKQVIIESRVKAAQTLKNHLDPTRIKSYIAAAAIGLYGDRGEEWVDEDSRPGEGFLTESCLAWEAAACSVAEVGVRMAALRIGLVLSTQGGALPKIAQPAQWYAAVYFGDGRQWYSWIHLDDLCRMFLFLMENEQQTGFYNAVGPQPERCKTLVSAVAKTIKKEGITLPAPAFALRLALGEMADTVLYSTRVSCDKVQATGFKFEFPELENALTDLYQRKV